MLNTTYLLRNLNKKFAITVVNRCFLTNSFIEVNEEVRYALSINKPLVALESTIITHGMPYPDNVRCALEVEDIVRRQGAIPATVAIMEGKIKAGLTTTEVNALGDTEFSNPIKTSRRDICFVVSNKLNGGTTVSGTLIVAARVGIPIFATGGIGGVHRGVANTFDISSDLTELGKSNVAVVSSGVKSILDIPKTLEYLETQGVFVATLGETDDFPAFYSVKSECKSPYLVKTVEEAARIIKCNKEINIQSGMLFAVPIPEENALPFEDIDRVILTALKSAEHHVQGKHVTPYLLSEVTKLTAGKSLQSNIALIKNNAKVAAEIAVILSNLLSDKAKKECGKQKESLKGRPVVIGGSNLDCSAALKTTDIKIDGRIYDARFSYTAGGVGRNICESLYKLGFASNFLSVVGGDDPGKLLRSFIPKQCRQLVRIEEDLNTAQCVIVFDEVGECKFLMGDMRIHRRITPSMISDSLDIIKSAPMIILDANLSTEALEEALKVADKYHIPVCYEPTDLAVSLKAFKTKHWRAISYMTPNLNELKYIANFLGIPTEKSFASNIEEAAYYSKKFLEDIELVIVTLGAKGAVLARRGGLATDEFVKSHQKSIEKYIRYYPTTAADNLVNVSGAGDCFTSGFVAAQISNLPEEICVSVGFAAAHKALCSQSAVPTNIFDRTHEAWKKPATFLNIEIV